MSIILDLILAGIVILCGYRGFRSGIINGICGLLAVVIAIYGAFLISTTYSSEFEGMLTPFAEGIIDNAITNVITYDENDDDAEAPVVRLSDNEKENVYAVSFAVLRQLGFPENVSKNMAKEIEKGNSKVDRNMAQIINSAVCSRVAYAVFFAVVFILISIIFSAIGNIFDLSFGLPGLENLNHIIGAVLGIFKGILIIMVLGCIFRYMGLFVSENIIGNTVLLRWLTELDILAKMVNL